MYRSRFTRGLKHGYAKRTVPSGLSERHYKIIENSVKSSDAVSPRMLVNCDHYQLTRLQLSSIENLKIYDWSMKELQSLHPTEQIMNLYQKGLNSHLNKDRISMLLYLYDNIHNSAKPSISDSDFGLNANRDDENTNNENNNENNNEKRETTLIPIDTSKIDPEDILKRWEDKIRQEAYNEGFKNGHAWANHRKIQKESS